MDNLWPPKDNDHIFRNTPPWAYTAKCTCLIKTPPKNPVGKKGSEKEYIAHASYVTLVASLKTLCDKTQWEKVTKGKRVQQLIFRISFDLRDLYEF